MLSELYQELILDHGKRPRNHRALAGANGEAEGFNPLCGDRVRVFLKLDGERIEDACFTGHGCAICTASASLMTQRIIGRSIDEAGADFRSFQQMLTAARDQPPPEDLGHLAALAGVRNYPMRVKCATLPWHTMKAALEGKGEASTE